MDTVCDLSIGGVGFGCVGNIAILALILLIFVAAAVYCVCCRKTNEPDSAPVQHSKADEEWSRAANGQFSGNLGGRANAWMGRQPTKLALLHAMLTTNSTDSRAIRAL